MKTFRDFFILIAISAILLMACGGGQDTSDLIATGVAQTMQISQLETAAAEAGSSTEVPADPPSSTPSIPTETISPTPEEIAPDPLLASHTGIILNNGECFNFDDGAVSAPDGQCDVWLVEPALFRQMNTAQISGYVTMTPPSQSDCVSSRYEPTDLGVMTDLYMCFISNEGGVGFIVVRQYLGGVPFTGIVFDYWLFS